MKEELITQLLFTTILITKLLITGIQKVIMRSSHIIVLDPVRRQAPHQRHINFQS